MYIGYNDMENALKQLKAFKGNSVTAIKKTRRPLGMLCGEGGRWLYCVYSYNTVILIVTSEGEYYFNQQKYSRTTSKLQNMIRYVFKGIEEKCKNTGSDALVKFSSYGYQ